jgi:hypothetical protein
MIFKSLPRQTLVVLLFLLSGCDVAHNAQRDFNRILYGSSTAAPPRSATTHSARASTAAKPPVAPSEAKMDEPKPQPPPARETAAATGDLNLVGKSEGQVRAMLGPPTSVEERAPGKTWHYRDGSCSVNVRLYPDVQTRQFGTLSYEVKSNDNSDEGRRDCMARLRARSGGGSG